MTREGYQAALDDLRTDVCALGDDVLAQLDDGLTALTKGDDGLAEDVIDGDAAINDRYLDLEGDCVDLLALQQPVASDLRFVAASFKILTDLERVGDLATNLGRYALAAERPADEVDVQAIGADARDQVSAALDAYETGDADGCRAVAARDDELDAHCQRASERVVRDLLEGEAGEDSWAVERVLDDVSRLLLTIRDLERVGDHGVNVAARTLYMIETDPELLY
ncbi:phosphate signaling complex protein PhoU [Halosimplex litoreum]|uniref:Phosphate-specific transport system accessory protein PhoU n=1 Tax=Halosimplex litoreum TaxID=1198301 RepID=A0A7U3WBU5_9EURY|nr:phosphate signaling complex protein PhoU [Halosimplex litoreum]QPV65090.1 phosphate signaling complex protein PhoU [Halosimplex litoreum]